MPQPPRLVPWRVAIPLTTAAAVAGAGIGFLAVSLVVNPTRSSASPDSAAPAAASAAPSESGSPAAARTSEPAAADADATKDAGGATDAGRAQTDAAAGDDLSSDAGLKPYESYLFVRSSAQADVWVHGIKIGPTNTKLKLACTKGLRFTRLGKDPGPAWISKAVSVKIPCGSVTELELEPEANPKPATAPQDSDNPY
ncbi:MAG: hypothetical protein AB7K71_35275 [Polyangiaceae bacterium]